MDMLQWYLLQILHHPSVEDLAMRSRVHKMLSRCFRLPQLLKTGEIEVYPSMLVDSMSHGQVCATPIHLTIFCTATATSGGVVAIPGNSGHETGDTLDGCQPIADYVQYHQAY